MEKLSITELIEKVHVNAKEKGFHKDVETINDFYDKAYLDYKTSMLLIDVAINSKLALINTEVAECTEALRKADYDNFGEELADVVIRCFDLAGLTEVNLEEEISKKIAVNEARPYLHNKRF